MKLICGDKMAKEKQERYSLGEVATETQKVFVDNETEQTMDLYAAILEILNSQRKLVDNLVSKD